ncbi:hypothetical protein PFISCL1PPCAC_26206 [Pristionchus fissidentatus]|uniref:Membrane transporter n=1 Tax=Pristionchus fissidentatus TaxID=1538716 RepID=A0AAV5WRW7_9BILA|nr:hypothetical protein PFISCL1PPCAC_26206 [Pristionchus fissidentatus]
MLITMTELVGNISAVSLSSLIVSSEVGWQLVFWPLVIIGVVVTPILLCILPTDLGCSTYVKRNVFDALKLLKVKSYLFLTNAAVFSGWYFKVWLFWMPTFVLSAWTNSPQVFFGLPYSVVMTITSLVELVASLFGLPLWLWIAQSWQSGKSCCKIIGAAAAAAFPIVAVANSICLAISSLVTIWASDRSYIVVLIAVFMEGFMGFSVISLNTQMTLSVSDARRRASALSLQRLLLNVVSIPGPQIIGVVRYLFFY